MRFILIEGLLHFIPAGEAHSFHRLATRKGEIFCLFFLIFDKCLLVQTWFKNLFFLNDREKKQNCEKIEKKM